MTWTRDSKVALRMLLRRPGFTFVVLITLGLGIGVNTALFGVFRAVFMEPIPLPASDRLVVIREMGGFGCCGPASGPDYLDWVERNRSFSGMAALNPGAFTLTGLEEAQSIRGTYVTASAFDLLEVPPLLGRALLPDDQDVPGSVVLSYRMWQDVMSGRGDVVGTTLELDGTPYTVVGVMPEGFDVPSPWAQMGDYELYLPFQNARLTVNRGSHGFPVIARMADGVSKESAEADMERVMRELAEEYPLTNGDRTTRIYMLHDYLFGRAGRLLGMILGAAALVLLIACGNVAGLLLARAAGRETELAVRAALGATRRTVVRLLFTESALLAFLGGALGVLVSLVAVVGLRAVLPASVPRIDQVRIDGWALLFALGAAAVTALAFGMLPSLLAARTNLAASVKEGGYSALSPAKERLRDAFIVGQIALGLVLAHGALLLVRSYTTLLRQEYGFESRGVLTMALSPSGPRYQKGQELQAYYDQVRARVAAIPGVTSVATVSKLPLRGGSNGNVWVEGRPPRTNAGEGPLVEVSSLTGDYFATMDIRLLKGRPLQADDSVTNAVGVVVNERFADEAWPGEEPLGRRFSFSDNPPNWLSVVGVVANVRQFGPERAAAGEMYAPFMQGWTSQQYLVLRTSGDPTLAGEVRRAVLSVDPTQPPTGVATMDEVMARTFAQRRFYTTLIALFAAAALFLACAGIYGTLSYFVLRRVRELGIRIALGAGRSGIMRLVLRRGVRLAGWGMAIGLFGVWAATSVLRGFVYGISAVDPSTLVAGTLAIGSVAVAASTLPALRAIRIPPVHALRAE